MEQISQKSIYLVQNRKSEHHHLMVNIWISLGSKFWFKVRLSPSKKIFFIYFDESPLKMMKNAFYFTLKAPIVLKIFKFLSWGFGHVERKSLVRKVRLISKFMTSQLAYQTMAIHIFASTSRIKGNQTLKFGQVIEYMEINIFLQKSYWKWDREISSRPHFVFQKSFIWSKSKKSTT